MPVPVEFRLRCYDEVASTNALVKQALEQGEPEGFVCRARRQTGGYGRQGRSWSSPEGGLYQSMLLRPCVLPAQLPTLGLVVALTMREALLGLCGAASDLISVKWPNDVMAADCKLVGISCETHGGGVCVGTGVNVLRPRDGGEVGGKNTPAYLEECMAADCVGDAGLVDRVGDAFLDAFSEGYERWQTAGFSAFSDGYRACSYLQGKEIALVLANGDALARGRVVGVDEQGCLLVDDGLCVRSFSSGEAHILRFAHACRP